MAGQRLAVCTLVRIVAFGIVCAANAGYATVACAQTPTAHQVIEKHIQAIGGHKAIAKVKSLEMLGLKTGDRRNVVVRIQQTAENYKGTLAHGHLEAPQQPPFFVGLRQGATVWCFDGTTYNQVEGNTRDHALMAWRLHPALSWRKQLDESAPSTPSEVDGLATWRVRFENAYGRTIYRDFDQTSGLLVQETMSEIDHQTSFQEYRAVDGVLIAHREVYRVPGNTTELTYYFVHANVEFPSRTFALPTETVNKFVASAETAGTPTVEDVIANYLQAIKRATEKTKITSFESHATVDDGTQETAVDKWITETGYLLQSRQFTFGRKDDYAWDIHKGIPIILIGPEHKAAMIQRRLPQGFPTDNTELKMARLAKSVISSQAEGHKTWCLLIEDRKTQRSGELHFDQTTWLPVKLAVFELAGTTIILSDYRVIAGFPFAFREFRRDGDSARTLVYEEIKLNEPIAEQVFAPPVLAEDDALAGDPAKFPQSKEVIEKYVNAIGGQDAIAKIKTLEMHALETPVGFDIVRDREEVVSERDFYFVEDGYRMRVKLPRFSEWVWAWRGDVGWTKGWDGSVHETTERCSDPVFEANKIVNPSAWLDGAENVIVANSIVQEQPAWRLTFVSKWGLQIHRYFEKHSGLLVREWIPGGNHDITFLEYREVSGVLMPHREVVTRKIGQSSTIDFYEIKANAQIPDSLFRKPSLLERLLNGMGFSGN